MGVEYSFPAGSSQRAVMHRDVFAAVLLDPVQQARSVLVHRLKGVYLTGRTHTATSKQGKEPNVRTNVPESHARFQNADERLLNGHFMRAGPVVLLASRVNQKVEPCTRTRAHDNGGRTRGHKAIDQRTKGPRQQRVIPERSRNRTWHIVQNRNNLLSNDHS